MKRIYGSLFALGFILLFNSCRNSTTVDKQNVPSHASDSTFQGTVNATDETLDTADCGSLIKMRVVNANSWAMGLKNAMYIKTKQQPRLQILMQKVKLNENDVDNLILLFELDSAVCVDNHCKVIFTMADNSKIELRNYGDNNCKGAYFVCFDYRINAVAKNKASADLVKIRNAKIQSVWLETHMGGYLYDLSDIAAINLQHRLNCLHEAK
jgi:hypothetical protein